jgi:hypothetical protein
VAAIFDPARPRSARNVFAISGANKLLVASRTRSMYETLAASRNTISAFHCFVSSIDLIGDCLLVIRLLSSLCCVALIIEMVVAITTIQGRFRRDFVSRLARRIPLSAGNDVNHPLHLVDLLRAGEDQRR